MPDAPPRVVINADDFGYSAIVNQAIEEALRRGRITSATLMANGPAVQEALSISREFPAASFGIHLNLTEFQPLSRGEGLRKVGLLGEDGSFLGNLRSLQPGSALLGACFEELDAQISFLISQGLRPSHLDSHHHVHTVPWLFPVIYRLQRRYGLRTIRNTMNVYSLRSEHAPSMRLLAAKELWQFLNRACGNRFTQVFTGYHIFLEDPSRKEFLRARSIELMCHPGQAGFEAETDQLMGEDHPIDDLSYQLCSYAALGG